MSKRFAYTTSGDTYNTTSDFPTTGSGFGVNTQALTLYAGFVIPEYSRICFMNYGGSPDAAISAVTQSGDIYSAFRNNGIWRNGKISASKDDLGVFLTASGTKAAVFNGYVEITNLKLYAGHTYLVLGKTGSSISVSLISARIVGPSSEYGSAFSFLDSRTTGSNGGGCITAAIITLTKDYTVQLQGYGYDNATYNYDGSLMAIQLK